MKKNFYLAVSACFCVVIITSILVIDNKVDILNSLDSKNGYVNLDKEFSDKTIETIPTTTGQDKNFQITSAEEQKTEEKPIEEVKEEKFSWPVKGEIEVKFSPDKIVYDKFLDEYSGSEEVTIEAKKNDEVKASKGGIVSKVSAGIIGQIVEIEHDGGYKTTYSNVCDVCVEEGELVKKNEVIGKVNVVDDKYSILRFSMKKDDKKIDPSKVIR